MVALNVIVLVVVLIGFVSAHPAYRDLFPNGYAVPNPCGNGTWAAVGHYEPAKHTHDKNQFGLDFASAGHTWNADICQKDSDGDGQTNGQELGDPFCYWATGTRPDRPASSHPGICEPIGSGVCASVAFSCGCHGPSCVGK